MSEIIVVTSGKGGVGKTTVTANLGAGLSMLGGRVVLIDTDIGLRNLDVVMGLENRIVYNLVDVVDGNCRVKQALIRDKRHPGLYLMPSAQTRDKTAVTPGQMVKVIEHLKEQFDYIILDCPAGIEQGFQNANAGAGCDNPGGFCHPGCRPDYRAAGGKRFSADGLDYQQAADGYGQTGRYDVCPGCGGYSGNPPDWDYPG